MARSNAPEATCGSSEVDVASTITSRISGWRLANSGSRKGTSHRAVVPITPEPRRARDRGVPHGGDVGSQGAGLGCHPAGPGHRRVAGIGQLAGAAVDQGRAQVALETRDVGRHVGLHGQERVGGGGEAAVIGDRDQSLELSQPHRLRADRGGAFLHPGPSL